MLRSRTMKPVLLLAFLALGPALAEQFPVVPPGSGPETAALLPARAGAVSPTARLDDERIWLCGR
jgi:hypothetical protein